MILFELRQFLKEQHTVSLKELCEHFESSEEAMEEMLQIWTLVLLLALDRAKQLSCYESSLM